jgi:hypothetical protein
MYEVLNIGCRRNSADGFEMLKVDTVGKQDGRAAAIATGSLKLPRCGYYQVNSTEQSFLQFTHESSIFAWPQIVIIDTVIHCSDLAEAPYEVSRRG